MNKKLKGISLLTLAAVILISVAVVGVNLSKKHAAEEAAAKLAAEKTRIAAEKALKAEKEKEAFSDLQSQLNSYIGSDKSRIGLIYFDLEVGTSIEINPDMEFAAASTVKVPMNITLLDLAQKGVIDFDSSVQYTESDYEGGTGILQGQDRTKPIPLRTLSEYSIKYSDNIATQMIIRTIGRDRMYDTFSKIAGHEVAETGNLTTPANNAAYLKRLYTNPNNNPYYAFLIANMKNTIFHDRIDKYIPQEITAHKIGNYSSYVNDIAIIYTKRPYVLVVFTNGVADAPEKIAQISKMIYKYQIGLK
ncbi:MAG TPA: serine hydrolase [Clostridiaceae bacterium]